VSQAKYRVRLLGGVALEMEGVRVAGRACQRKRLALLGLLGAASGHRLSRDKVLSYLWAEVDAHRARNALSQLLHGLKQQLGVAVGANSDEIWLNNALIAVDVAQFRGAIAASDWNTAISLYGGPFLDGFFTKAGPDFEHWVDELRSGLKLDYAFALQRAALAASNCGHNGCCARVATAGIGRPTECLGGDDGHGIVGCHWRGRRGTRARQGLSRADEE